MSKQVQELLDGAGAGRWMLPSPDEPNPVSLARAVGAGNGVSAEMADPVAERFHSLIGDPDHLIFVIADGWSLLASALIRGYGQ